MLRLFRIWKPTLKWCHNEYVGVSNHQPYDYSFNRLFRRRSKKTSELRVTGLCAVTGEFPTQRASNAENLSICWRQHAACRNFTWLENTYSLRNEQIKLLSWCKFHSNYCKINNWTFAIWVDVTMMCENQMNTNEIPWHVQLNPLILNRSNTITSRPCLQIYCVFVENISVLLFKFDGEPILLSHKLYQSNRYETLHMSTQLCCHGMCKIV